MLKDNTKCPLIGKSCGGKFWDCRTPRYAGCPFYHAKSQFGEDTDKRIRRKQIAPGVYVEYMYEEDV